jgi:ABC-type transport system involved in multi-copper enzyme maturation permease subunit
VTDAAQPGTGSFARDVALVARFELAESVRSRLLLVMVLLFVGGGALGAWGYTRLIAKIEQQAAEVLGAPASARPGATVNRMRDARTYRDLLYFFLRDEAKADYYARLPPIVVFYGWAAFLFTPWLILFTAAETIAAEVASRSIRFSLLRTGRLPYALGKAAGQLAVLLAVTGLCALVFHIIAWVQLDGFEPGATALWLLAYWPRILLYNLPFLAFALAASMVAGSANLARMLALGGAVLLAIASGVAGWSRLRSSQAGAVIGDLIAFVTPFGHNDGLSYPPGGALAGDVLVCLALAVLYFAAGFAVLARRDL